MSKEPIFDEMSDFEKWFYGSDAYADGDLEKDKCGEYIMPMTQEFEECWNAAVQLTRGICE